MQHLPWESIPVLSDQQVSRVPSLIHLHMQVRRSRVTGGDVLVKGVNPDSTFFVLNPDRDLPSTQKTFEDMFTKWVLWYSCIPSYGIIHVKESLLLKNVVLTSLLPTCCCCLYLFWCLYLPKVQARCPGHTLQLSELSVQESELVGFGSLVVY